MSNYNINVDGYVTKQINYSDNLLMLGLLTCIEPPVYNIILVCPIKCNPSIILADVANICFVQREVIRYFGIFTGDIHCRLCSIITELSGESDIEHLPGISTRFTFNPE